MYGDDEPLNQLRREVQELAQQVKEQAQDIFNLKGRLIELSKMLEDERYH